MDRKDVTGDYALLQETIDRVLGKIGLKKMVFLLNSFISDTRVASGQHEKLTMITHYIKNQAIQAFDLSEELFLVSEIREYRDARMCCFHLLRKYTGDTCAKIGLSFHRSSRIVTYGCNITEERLSIPKGNSGFVSNYKTMESRLLDFMARIN